MRLTKPLLLFVILFISLVLHAQDDPQVQELTAQVSAENPIVWFDLYGMEAGQTLYIYMESDEIDPLVVICDINCEENYAQDDDSGGSLNAALEYTFPSAGDYSIAAADCCDDTAEGSFRIVIGLDAPEVLEGTAEPTGAEIAVPFGGVQASQQTDEVVLQGDVQELTGSISPDTPTVWFDLFNVQAEQRIYIYLESDDFDPYVVLCDIQCEESFAADDDSGGDFNAALDYKFSSAGDYSIAVTDCCDEDASGEFRLLIGFEAPAVLTGDAQPTGVVIAVPYDGTPETPVVEPVGQVQELQGAVSPDSPTIWFDLFGMEAGQTIYVYAESDAIDTYLIVCDLDCEEHFAEDDDSGGGTNSALSFTFETSGDYSIAVRDCCNEDAQGEFRLLIGLDNADVLTGDAVPTGAEIAVVYHPEPVVVDSERTDPVDCDRELQERPELSGPVLTRETENFVIHYTTFGTDKVDELYVDGVEAVMEDILRIQTVELGWPVPPPDCGEGGDSRFDVYLLETISTEDAVGYAQPGGVVVDNPNSEFEETWAAYSYLVIDNDMVGVSGAPLALMRSTAAHEFHHTIQFGYDIADELNWFYEATATWMETQTFIEDEDATPYVSDLFSTTDICVGSRPPDAPLRVYAEWLLIDSLRRDFGVESIQRMWELVADEEGMEVFYSFAREFGSSPQEVMLRFAIRNLLLDYGLSDNFDSQVRVEANINGVGEIKPRRSGVQELGIDYVFIADRRVHTFSINAPNLHLYLVGIDREQGEAWVFDIGQEGTVDTAQFSHAYVLILNTDLHDHPDECVMTDWLLTVTPGDKESQLSPMPETFNAAAFEPAGQSKS